MAKKIKSKVYTTTQTFLFDAPEAREVKLAGDFTEWETNPIPMEKNEDGTWQATVDLAPGQYHYLFLVDGNWNDDPNCGLHLPNPFGGRNAVRQVA